MQYFQSKYGFVRGSSRDEIIKHARKLYHEVQKQSPRRVPYVRSKYFMGRKVFISNFWEHLKQMRIEEQTSRLKYYQCALELLRDTTLAPTTIYGTDRPNDGLHRFYGKTISGKHFCVQVKHSKRTGRLDFMSVFPTKK